MKLVTGALLCVASCSLLSACADGVDVEAQQDDSVTEQAVTGSNPRIDVSYISEIVSPPAGMTYSDFTFDCYNTYYIARSDGRQIRYRGKLSPVYGGYPAGTFNRIDYVQSSTPSWDLISTEDSTRRIFKNSQNIPSLIGSYPAGVTAVSDIAGRMTGNYEMDVWIVYGRNYNTYVRAGHYSVMSGTITWAATETAWGRYSSGLAWGRGPDNNMGLLSQVNYYTSYFLKYQVPAMTVIAENTQGYTDHAYAHPYDGGARDTFGPVGFTYCTNDDYFYGLDRYYNAANGKTNWVIARMPGSAIRH